MSPFWASLTILASVVTGTAACFWLLYQAREFETTVWILEHIICPIIRILVLLILVSQVYPLTDGGASGLDFWSGLIRQGHFSDLVNLLFLAGLALAFLPYVNHPAIALPLQSLLTAALIFHWQTIATRHAVDLWPTLSVLLKIAGLAFASFLLTREASLRVGRWIDHRFALEGSATPAADATYLLLQIPIILVYLGYLNGQLSATGA